MCLSEIRFSISIEEYESTKEFPMIKELIHGDPAHTLIVFLNKNLEIENFEIKDAFELKASLSEELTNKVLSEIGLSNDEIKLYFLTSGRDTVSLSELPLLIDKTKEECEEITKKFVQKGLFKEIIGITPHFSPLPPYAALITQLHKFHEYIKDIKISVPNQLMNSFSQLEAKTEGVKQLKEYTDFMIELKKNLTSQLNTQKQEINNALNDINQINDINKIISNLEEDTKKIMDSQIEELTNQFEDIKTRISQNLQKFHLGVIKQTVTQVIENVLTTRLKTITQNFNEQFISKLKEILKDASTNVNKITTTSTKTGENIKGFFEEISENFGEVVMEAGEKIGGISESIFQSFSDLRNIFSTKIIDTLNRVLSDILERLEISETTTNEFWDQAKKETLFTMKDIWFIRSLESAKAHINEEISKAKMRVLIVSPNITDIDINSLVRLPRHVNVRIAANIDVYSEEHLAILQELDDMPNVSYRHYKLQNLWGINRDFEEVILSIISKTEVGGEMRTEIGGIGSIIQEHIKIFVPVLEEAWIRAQKEVLVQKPAITQEPLQISSFPTEPETIQPDITNETEKVETIMNQSRPTTQPSLKISLEEENEKQDKDIPLISSVIEKTVSTSLSEQYDEILDNIEVTSSQQIAIILDKFKNNYIDEKGYHSILTQINRSISILQNNPKILTKAEKNQLITKMNFWRNKLNI